MPLLCSWPRTKIAVFKMFYHFALWHLRIVWLRSVVTVPTVSPFFPTERVGNTLSGGRFEQRLNFVNQMCGFGLRDYCRDARRQCFIDDLRRVKVSEHDQRQGWLTAVLVSVLRGCAATPWGSAPSNGVGVSEPFSRSPDRPMQNSPFSRPQPEDTLSIYA